MHYLNDLRSQTISPCHHPPSLITSQLVEGKTRVSVGNVSPKRDFTFVLDTCHAFLLLAQSQQAVGEIINIGTGTQISIHTEVEVISLLMGRPIELVQEEIRMRPSTSDVEISYAVNLKTEEKSHHLSRKKPMKKDWKKPLSGSYPTELKIKSGYIMSKTAVILAGGLGTRLEHYTKNTPKSLLPVHGHPILEILICQLAKAGITRIILAVHFFSHEIRSFCKDGSQWNVSIELCPRRTAPLARL